MTPLLFAASVNNLHTVKVLLDAKAEVNVQNKVSESDGVLLKSFILFYMIMTVDRAFSFLLLLFICVCSLSHTLHCLTHFFC
jgi:ankyrin repeat protein